MKSLMIAALTLPLAGAALAQSADVSSYTDVDGLEIMGADNDEVGEIETVLVDGSGQPVAFVVEVDDGFLDLGDTEVVMNVDDLTWDGDQYTTEMTADEVEQLPTWDD
ncbi:PRC-barrel domain-containing protein [Palleronia sp. LCG004]|uniref:PRC-barrel domain-containing protein n=1 Tax=Palleronia sp. LCG004 TaxID=3079304 RepID=UPI002942A0B0|nr:PRC-barrel domain-containing protein [Palleronia sp. LCG004]WOI58052.1 PRC-barrel domain-containing protein [Palleronia sp. LCG004]